VDGDEEDDEAGGLGYAIAYIFDVWLERWTVLGVREMGWSVVCARSLFLFKLRLE
jgi:hypothetical protein